MNSMNRLVPIHRLPGRRGPEYVERSLAIVWVGTLRFERFKSETGVRLGPMLVERFKLVVFFCTIVCRPR